MLLDMLKNCPTHYIRTGTITRPLALYLSKQEHTMALAEKLMEEAVKAFHAVELVLMPIILNGHFHLLVLDKEKKAYFHYNSLENPIYHGAAYDMVVHANLFSFGLCICLNVGFCFVQRKLFERSLSVEYGGNPTEEYPLIHVKDCPRQKSGSVDCSVYVMTFMEQILYGKEPQIRGCDVPHIRLQYVARILVDGMNLKNKATTKKSNLCSSANNNNECK